ASGGFAAIQYWLVNYNTNCPAGQNWNQIALFGGTSCWKNATNSVTVPNQPITNMANWRLTGTATATGDSVAMSTRTHVYTPRRPVPRPPPPRPPGPSPSSPFSATVPTTPGTATRPPSTPEPRPTRGPRSSTAATLRLSASPKGLPPR